MYICGVSIENQTYTKCFDLKSSRRRCQLHSYQAPCVTIRSVKVRPFNNFQKSSILLWATTNTKNSELFTHIYFSFDIVFFLEHKISVLKMNWYPGNIAEAVNLSKTRNAIFVVYCEGTIFFLFTNISNNYYTLYMYIMYMYWWCFLWYVLQRPRHIVYMYVCALVCVYV